MGLRQGLLNHAVCLVYVLSLLLIFPQRLAIWGEKHVQSTITVFLCGKGKQTYCVIKNSIA